MKQMRMGEEEEYALEYPLQGSLKKFANLDYENDNHCEDCSQP